MRTRIEREQQIVAQMIEIYCRANHHTTTPCDECSELLTYAMKRLEHCPYGEQKTVCSRCQTHCYKPSMRTKIVHVMRYAGRRMVTHAPVSALWHLWRVVVG